MRGPILGDGGRSRRGLAAPLLLIALCVCLNAGEARADFSDLDTFMQYLALEIIHTERKSGRLTDKGVLVDPNNFFEQGTKGRLPLSEELSHRLTTELRRRGVRVLSGSGKEDVMILRGRWRDVPGEAVLSLTLSVGKLVCTERVVAAFGEAETLVCEEAEVEASADGRILRDAVEAYLEADLEFWGRHAIRELERAAPGGPRRPVFILPPEVVGVPRPERFVHFGQYLVLGWLTPAFAGSRLFYPVPSRAGDSRELSVHVFVLGRHVEVVLRMLDAQGMYAAKVRMEKTLFRDTLPSDAETLLAECGEHLEADRLAVAAQCYERVQRDYRGNAVANAQADAGLRWVVDRYVESVEEAIDRGTFDEAELGRLRPYDLRVAELQEKIETAQRAIDEAKANRRAEEEAARRRARIERAIEGAEEAIGRGTLDEARGHVAELDRLSPGHPRVAELDGRIGTAQRAVDEAEAKRKAEERAAARHKAQVERAIASAEGAIGRGALEEARGQMERLRALNSEHPRVAALEREIAKAELTPEMVRIEEGCFQMGSSEAERERFADERRHRACVEAFSMGKHAVTRGQFAAFVRETGRAVSNACRTFENGEWRERSGRSWRSPGYGQQGTHPVVCVSLEEAQAYARWLSGETGRRYRLPTEVEWEYAARAGTQTSRHWGEDPSGVCAYANVADRTLKETNSDWEWTIHDCLDGYMHTAPLGSFGANAWGLHDMLGNVWEWTCSEYDEGYGGAEHRCASGSSGRRVVRGGSWGNALEAVRSAYRIWSDAAGRSGDLGFRLAQD